MAYSVSAQLPKCEAAGSPRIEGDHALPPSWRAQQIGEFSKPVRGSSPRPAGDPKYFNGSAIPWLTVGSITTAPDHQSEISTTDTMLTSEGKKRSRLIPRNTVVIANSGFSLGVAKLLTIDSCANDGIAALSCLDDNINPKYLVYYINHITEYLREIVAIGNDQPNLNTDRISKIVVPLPEKDEQGRIVQTLEAVDALIASLEILIAKKQGALQDLLNGQRRLPGFTTDWLRKSIGSLFELGRTVPLSRAQLRNDGDVAYIHYGDIHTRLHTHLDFRTTFTPAADEILCGAATSLRVGDWVFADASEDYEGVAKAIEIVGLPMTKGAVSGLHTLLLRERVPTFALGFKGYLAYAPTFRAQIIRAATGMKVYSISKTQMRDFELFFPPDIAEQRAIVTTLSDMDAEIAALKARLAKTRDLKQGMMQVLLTGKVQLV
jgi:type I restriction enzyme S subunit